MKKIKIETEFIKLDQFLKWVGVVGSGVEAKDIILNEEVLVNGETEIRRGKKLYTGDKVEVNGDVFIVD